MSSTLDTIINNPTIIRDYLYNHLEEIRIQTGSKHYIVHDINNTTAFTYAHVVKKLIDVPDAFIYKFNHLDLFYSLVFLDYTYFQIKQLSSLLKFMEDIFNNRHFTKLKKNCEIWSADRYVMCSCIDFILECRDSEIKFRNTQFSFVVEDLSFEPFYNKLLIQLQQKICNSLDKTPDMINSYDITLLEMLKI